MSNLANRGTRDSLYCAIRVKTLSDGSEVFDLEIAQADDMQVITLHCESQAAAHGLMLQVYSGCVGFSLARVQS